VEEARKRQNQDHLQGLSKRKGWILMRANKQFVEKVAEDLNAMYASMDETREDPNRQDTYFENRGAYFYTLSLIDRMGSETALRVFDMRQELRKKAA
jgi:hypothetical protein